MQPPCPPNVRKSNLDFVRLTTDLTKLSHFAHAAVNGVKVLIPPNELEPMASYPDMFTTYVREPRFSLVLLRRTADAQDARIFRLSLIRKSCLSVFSLSNYPGLEYIGRLGLGQIIDCKRIRGAD